jgi:hypothetical protein
MEVDSHGRTAQQLLGSVWILRAPRGRQSGVRDGL